MRFKEFAVTFEKPLDELELTISNKQMRWFGRFLIRGALTFNDFIWVEDPWDKTGDYDPGVNPKYK